MNRKAILRRTLLIIPITLLVCLLALGSFYTYWNAASPARTCASCHEIGSSVTMLFQSAHRNLACSECHGTALSNGFHSLKEKGMMVVHHMQDSAENIGINENQLMQVMNHCARCHTSEYANWSSGGHSARYKDIFLHAKHNATEQLNPDCLRCHGMFNDGTIRELVFPLDKSGPWRLNDPSMADRPAIPCMACHQIHNEGFPLMNPDYADPKKVFYRRSVPHTIAGFYDRHEKAHLQASDLPKLRLFEGARSVNVSDEPLMRNCIQCHAPNAMHQAGTGDDRTPRGVHEGFSCISCHQTHSNNARNSCITCHPAISNCKQDVTKMNTSYYDPDSPNNIHTVSCTDCHAKENTRLKSSLKR
jgi:hypothetical protein